MENLSNIITILMSEKIYSKNKELNFAYGSHKIETTFRGLFKQIKRIFKQK